MWVPKCEIIGIAKAATITAITSHVLSGLKFTAYV